MTITDTPAARARLLEIIKEKAIVHGRVTLSSGKEADYYVDLRRISLDGEAAPLVGVVMRDLTKDLDYEAAGGLTLGADPVATSMLHAAAAAGERCDAFVVRKEGKAHGLQQRIEGPSVAGRRVVVVEDTTTTGDSPIAAIRAVREAGGEVGRRARPRRSRPRASPTGSLTPSRTSVWRSRPTKFSAPLRYFAGTPTRSPTPRLPSCPPP